MQIMELGRPFTGGSWCGFSSGLAVYYSETSTITATVKYFQENTSFQFKLRYRFLKDDEVKPKNIIAFLLKRLQNDEKKLSNFHVEEGEGRE